MVNLWNIAINPRIAIDPNASLLRFLEYLRLTMIGPMQNDDDALNLAVRMPEYHQIVAAEIRANPYPLPQQISITPIARRRRYNGDLHEKRDQTRRDAKTHPHPYCHWI